MGISPSIVGTLLVKSTKTKFVLGVWDDDSVVSKNVSKDEKKITLQNNVINHRLPKGVVTNSDIWNLLVKLSILAYVLLKIGYFEVRQCLWLL